VGVPFVGLTGGIGAGKSTALEELAGLGAAVVSADDVVHELYGTSAVRDAVRGRFGDAVFDGPDVDRTALARRVFASDSDRAWLEALLWPLVADRVERFRAAAVRRRPPPPAVVVEVPLLFEAGSEARFAATIAIVADDALRAARIAARDQAELARREQRQLPQDEKARRAGYVVTNDGTRAQLRDRLRAVLADLAA
jgi:dephospho-CoA kinase